MLARPISRRFFPRSNLLYKHFHTTAATMVKVGDPVPNVDLTEGSPGNKINLSQTLKRGLIIGVPAAFSPPPRSLPLHTTAPNTDIGPACSETHVPGYIASEKTKAAGDVYVVSVNDAFVMKAWGKSLDPEASSGIHFAADASGAFTNALDLGFDASALLGNTRSKRYTLVVEDGKVKSVHVEPDNTGVNVSAVEKVLA